MKKTKEELRTEIKKLQKELKQVRNSEKDGKKDHIPCVHCKALNKLNTLDVVVRLFYVPPSGCSDGAYWTDGSSPTFYITCPKCNVTSEYDEAMYGDTPTITTRRDQIHWSTIKKNRWGKKFKSVTEKEMRS